MARGGKRPGAGRPKKDRAKQDQFPDAESYLLAVVQGLTPPDSVRVQAAKTLISYEIPKKRNKVESPPPKTLKRKADASVEKDKLLKFEEKAKKIREKHAKKNDALKKPKIKKGDK